MGYATINGMDVLETRLQLPRTGNWVADVVVDAATAAQLAPGTHASLGLDGGGLSFAGTVLRADEYVQMVILRLLGGAGGLGKPLNPKFYVSPPVNQVFRDMLADAGETISRRSTPAIASLNLPFWVTAQQPVGSGLSNLAAAADPNAVWRVQADGSVFLGVDGFPDSALTDYDLISYLPQENIQVIAAELPDVFPGEMFAGKKVSTVEHYVDSRSNRVTIWFGDS